MSAQASSFDYIIVGGGTTGCVLAARLSEDPAIRVLLVEAGSDDRTARTRDPGRWLSNFHPGSPLDHGLEATQTAGSRSRSARVLRGKALGGTSAVNAMIYHRGTPHDFDSWEAIGGCGGWSYADVAPYYVKIERCAPTIAEAGAARGRDGVIAISGPRSGDHAISAQFIDACGRHGAPLLPTLNGTASLGVGFHEFTVDADGARSSARDYVRRALAEARANLAVRTDTACRRVLFDNATAVGVEVQDARTGAIESVRSTREVIVCGGTIASPHLLLRSGVGARADLDAHGIDCVVDLPGVGRDLQDHVGFFLDYAVSPAWLESQASGGSHGGGDLSVFLRVNGDAPSGPADDGVRPNAQIEFFAFNRYSAPDVAFSTFMGVLPNRYFAAAQERGGAEALAAQPKIGFLVGLTKPRGRGAVSLASADPRDRPRIETRCFDSDEDLRDAVAALRYARSLARAMACAGDELLPGLSLDTDEELGEYVCTVGQSKHHPTGTCRMGTLERDPLAVVDGSLRVHGCKRLRVADCSVLPEVVTANSQAVAMVLGEKLADMIRGATPRA